jgi:hypothetical protein
MLRNLIRPPTLGLCVALLWTFGLRAGEAPCKAEELLPDSTLAALLVPDLGAARAAAAKTRLAEMYSRPEMQAFLAPPLGGVKQVYAGLRKQNALLPSLEDLDTGLLSGKIAAGMYSRKGEGPPFGVLLTVAPKDGAAFLRMLPDELRQPLVSGQPLPLGVEPSAPGLAWTGNRLIACVPQADLEGFVARAKNPPGGAGSLSAAPGFRAARQKLSLTAGWLYVDLPSTTAVLAQLAPPGSPNAPMLAAFKSLDSPDLTHAAAGLGFTPTDPIAELHLGFAAPPKTGLFSLCGETAPVGAAGLKIAAPDAPYVSAGHFQFSALLPLVRQVIQAVEPEAVPSFDQGLANLKQALGFDVQKDFLENLGSEVVAAQTHLDTAAPLSALPGLVWSVPVADPAKMEDCLNKLGAFLEKLPTQKQLPVKLKTLSERGQTIHYFSALALTPPYAFCVAGRRLLAATSVNALRRSLEQLEQPRDILSHREFQETLARLSGQPFNAQALPASFSYAVDTGSGTGALLLAGGGLASSAAALGALAGLKGAPADAVARPAGGDAVEEFFKGPGGEVLLKVAQDVDLALWPDEGFFKPYRRASGCVVTFGPDGLYWRCELPPPLPGAGSGPNPMVMTSMVAIVAAIAIPNLLRSRMAANETAAMAACKCYAEAQEIYRRTDWNGDGVLEYAQSIRGDCSLYEKKAGAGDISLVDTAFARAEGNPGEATPKAGYCFKVLKGQGPGAPGGKKSYVGDGKHMTLGYALVAYPATHDNSGRNTFLINNTGTVYQCDLGAETHAIVKQMTEYDPKAADMIWTPSE